MTDEQINAAIAEACGRKRNPKGGWYPDNGWEFGTQGILNYCNDINAMHEAEKVFDCPELYEGNLIKVCGGVQYMWHATARKRAEALLRTLGKWHQSGDATEMVKEVQK